MLKFKILDALLLALIVYLNTSHVKVQVNVIEYIAFIQFHLNTSHVKVQGLLLSRTLDKSSI